MPSVRAKRIRHNKFRDDNGNIIEVKMWQVTPSTDKPHGYKYSLVYIVNGKRVLDMIMRKVRETIGITGIT